MKVSEWRESTNITQDIINEAGEAPKKPLKYTGDFKDNAWGKNSRHRASLAPDGTSGVYCDHKANPKKLIGFRLKDHDFKESKKYKNGKIKEEEPKDKTKAFHTLSEPNQNHPYLIKKSIDLSKLSSLKLNSENCLCVPAYNQEGQIISWQRIYEDGDKKWIQGKLGKGYFYPIGEFKEGDTYVYVAEGVATGYTINQITNKKTYCSFGKDNLDDVCSALLEKYPKCQIILCQDHDKPEIQHKTKVKNNRLTILCPKKIGDFWDFWEDSQEQYKLLNPETYNLLKRLDTKIKETSYVDEIGKQLMRGYVGVLCGEKGAMKSKGILSYLSSNKIKTGYFSAGEVTEEQANAIDKAHIENPDHTGITGDEEMYIHWLDFFNKETWENIDKIISHHKIEIVVEDPPLLSKEMGTMEGLQKYITSRAKIAERHNIAWVCTKNFAKKEYKNILNKVSGYALWTSIPRWLTGVWQIEEGHELRNPQEERDQDTGEIIKPEKPQPKSLFQQVVNNVTSLPSQSLLLSFKEVPLKQKGETGTVDVGITDISKIDKVKNPDQWIKAPDINKQDKWDTSIWQILHYIHECESKGGVKSLDLVKKICSKDFLGWSSRTVYRNLKNLKSQKFIIGGGRGTSSQPYKLLKAGKEFLETVASGE